MPDFSWPPMEDRKVIGQRISRLDGPAKASGRAKYASDFWRQDLLFAALLTSPHAHAKIRSIDVAAAKQHVTLSEQATADYLAYAARLGKS